MTETTGHSIPVQKRAASGLRILIVSNLYAPQAIGGAEIVAQRQAEQLASRGHYVAALVGWLPEIAVGVSPPKSDLVGRVRIYRFPIDSMDQARDFHFPNAAAAFVEVMQRERPDIVHMHNLRGLGVNLIPIAKAHGAQVVVTLHDMWGHCYWATRLRPDGELCLSPEECGTVCHAMIESKISGTTALVPVRLRRDYLLQCLDCADLLLAPRTALAAAYTEVGIDPGRLIVLSNGIDLQPFVRAGRIPMQDQVRFVVLATLSHHKGIQDLLEAAALLWDDETLRGRWQLAIVGRGPLQERVIADIAAARFGNAVRYLGHIPRDRVPGLLAETDVVVLPSRWPENEPLALLEAVAAGVAQVATDVGGSRELVVPGRSGELVCRGDLAGLAGTMAAYVRAPVMARLHGSFNVARRGDFDESATISALEAHYRRLLEIGGWSRDGSITVICGWGTPPPGVAAICSCFHQLEVKGERIRFVWHEWASPSQWQAASLFWNWDLREDEVSLDTSSRKHRDHLPLLTQRHHADAPSSNTITYQSTLEAAAALALLVKCRSSPGNVDELLNCTRQTDRLAAAAGELRTQYPAFVNALLEAES